MTDNLPQIILASGSIARQEMLTRNGVDFQIEPARVDEVEIKRSLLSEGAKPSEIVDTLAEYKARQIAGKHPHALVIGADQILVADGKLYDKAVTIDEARAKLRELRGKLHQLMSAVVIYENQKPVWRTMGRAQLIMRDFSDEFLEGYLEKHGCAILSSVGCYFLEDDGPRLFSRIQGDYFTVLGFPLTEVLGFLYTRGAIQS